MSFEMGLYYIDKMTIRYKKEINIKFYLINNCYLTFYYTFKENKSHGVKNYSRYPEGNFSEKFPTLI